MAIAYSIIWFCAKKGHWLKHNSLGKLNWCSLIVLFFVPAFAEEFIFRAVLVPYWKMTNHQWFWIGFSTYAFVVWHIIEGFTFFRRTKSILHDTWFLACTAILGFACAYMLTNYGSIWPCVFMHFAIVIVWKTYLGGDQLINRTKLMS